MQFCVTILENYKKQLMMNFSFYRWPHGVFFLCIFTYPVFSQRIPVSHGPDETTLSQQLNQLTEKTYGIDQEPVVLRLNKKSA
jgi:hypothetical protein